MIPALDEERAIAGVLDELEARGGSAAAAGAGAAGPAGYEVREIVVVDNGSTDGTAAVARSRGATVVSEPRRGYGAACLAGIAHLSRLLPDVIVFLDADGSDDPSDLAHLLAPIVAGEADLVIGSRVRGNHEPGSLTPVQAFGNRVATLMLRVAFGVASSDLGPFRAIRWPALERLEMRDRGYGWTVEMQARAARARLRAVEVPVASRRRRAGRSKVSGTLRGVIGAGTVIPLTILRVRLGG